MKYKMTLEYDGTGFSGWQSQKTVANTVQNILQQALKTALRVEVALEGSGRTDAGVHALGQVAHFKVDKEINTFTLMGSINALVRPNPVCVRAIERVADDFHARFSAKQRTYLYRIQNSYYPPILKHNRVWWTGGQPLDVQKMNQAAQLLIGKHDFSTFRAADCQAHSPIKTIDGIVVFETADEIQMRISAKSFLYHQVRNIMGSLVNVGNGKWQVSDFEAALKACDRTKGGVTAPAAGLYFEQVIY